jgi:hypothetical protein
MLHGRPCVRGGLRMTHRPYIAPRHQLAVGPTPRAARRLCHPRLACGRGQLAVPVGAKKLATSSIPSLSFAHRGEQAGITIHSAGHHHRRHCRCRTSPTAPNHHLLSTSPPPLGPPPPPFAALRHALASRPPDSRLRQARRPFAAASRHQRSSGPSRHLHHLLPSLGICTHP